MTAAVEVEHLSKSFGDQWALRQVSFSVSSHETLLIVGQNGAGKSTLLSLLAGMTRLSEGHVRVGETRWSASDWRPPRPKSVGLVTSRPLLYRSLTVRENLEYFADLSTTSDAQHAVETALATFALEHVQRKLLSTCSDGIVRRTSIARATLHAPAIYLLDEPLVHLDRESQERALEFFSKECARGAAIIVSSHEPELWAGMHVRSVVLASGRLANRDKGELGLCSPHC